MKKIIITEEYFYLLKQFRPFKRKLLKEDFESIILYNYNTKEYNEFILVLNNLEETLDFFIRSKRNIELFESVTLSKLFIDDNYNNLPIIIIFGNMKYIFPYNKNLYNETNKFILKYKDKINKLNQWYQKRDKILYLDLNNHIVKPEDIDSLISLYL